MIVKTEAIVLKSFDFRETSRIATFFTKEFGKVKGVLKGARKDPRKFGSSVDNFSLNDIVYYRYRNSDIHLVSQCDMKDFFSGLRDNLERMTAASYTSELVDALIVPEEKNLEIYHLMQAFLRRLQTEDDIARLVCTFQIQALSFSGFKPHLEDCISCSRKVNAQPCFSLNLGGLVCGQCRRGPGRGETGEVTPISLGAVASILHIQNNGWDASMRMRMTPVVRKELKYVLNHFLAFHLERHLRSTRFLP